MELSSFPFRVPRQIFLELCSQSFTSGVPVPVSGLAHLLPVPVQARPSCPTTFRLRRPPPLSSYPSVLSVSTRQACLHLPPVLVGHLLCTLSPPHFFFSSPPRTTPACPAFSYAPPFAFTDVTPYHPFLLGVTVPRASELPSPLTQLGHGSRLLVIPFWGWVYKTPPAHGAHLPVSRCARGPCGFFGLPHVAYLILSATGRHERLTSTPLFRRPVFPVTLLSAMQFCPSRFYSGTAPFLFARAFCWSYRRLNGLSGTLSSSISSVPLSSFPSSRYRSYRAVFIWLITPCMELVSLT